MTPSGKFAFALVGCGGVGKKRAAAMPEGCELVRAYDSAHAPAVDVMQARGKAWGWSSYQKCYEDREVDAVIVATPNAHLYGIAYDAIKAGKHVLVEKPGAISSAQLGSLKKIAAHHGRHVHVGYNHRYHPAIAKAHQMVREGALGPLMHIRGRYGHGGRLGYEKEWRFDKKLSGGGQLMDQGVHLIDLTHWFMGDFAQISWHIGTAYWDTQLEDNALVAMKQEGGRSAILHTSCTEWKNLFSFEIFGMSGKLHIDGLGGSYGTERFTHYAMKPEMGPPDTTTWEYPQPDNSWKLELEDFVKQATTRPNQDSLVDAIKVLEVVERIYAR